MENITLEQALEQVQIVLNFQKLTKQDHIFLDACMTKIKESITKTK